VVVYGAATCETVRTFDEREGVFGFGNVGLDVWVQKSGCVGEKLGVDGGACAGAVSRTVDRARRMDGNELRCYIRCSTLSLVLPGRCETHLMTQLEIHLARITLRALAQQV